MDILMEKIDIIDFQIYNLSRILNKKQSLLVTWEMNRLNWYKNRHVYYFLYFFKTIPKKMLSYICSLKKLDNRLINIWKIPKFKNICSFDIFLNQNSDICINKYCRVPLFFRKFSSIFYIQKYTGCICCSTIYGINEPIWWDEERKIRILSNIKFNENKLKFILISSLAIKKFLKILSYYNVYPNLKICDLFYKLRKKQILFFPISVIDFPIYRIFSKKKKKNFC